MQNLNWKKGCVFGHIGKFWKGHDGQIEKNACKNAYLGSIFIPEKYVIGCFLCVHGRAWYTLLPFECPPPGTLYRGLWKATILSPSQPPLLTPKPPLPPPHFWKVWLHPCCGALSHQGAIILLPNRGSYLKKNAGGHRFFLKKQAGEWSGGYKFYWKFGQWNKYFLRVGVSCFFNILAHGQGHNIWSSSRGSEILANIAECRLMYSDIHDPLPPPFQCIWEPPKVINTLKVWGEGASKV